MPSSSRRRRPGWGGGGRRRRAGSARRRGAGGGQVQGRGALALAGLGAGDQQRDDRPVRAGRGRAGWRGGCGRRRPRPSRARRAVQRWPPRWSSEPSAGSGGSRRRAAGSGPTVRCSGTFTEWSRCSRQADQADAQRRGPERRRSPMQHRPLRAGSASVGSTAVGAIVDRVASASRRASGSADSRSCVAAISSRPSARVLRAGQELLVRRASTPGAAPGARRPALSSARDLARGAAPRTTATRSHAAAPSGFGLRADLQSSAMIVGRAARRSAGRDGSRSKFRTSARWPARAACRASARSSPSSAIFCLERRRRLAADRVGDELREPARLPEVVVAAIRFCEQRGSSRSVLLLVKVHAAGADRRRVGQERPVDLVVDLVQLRPSCAGGSGRRTCVGRRRSWRRSLDLALVAGRPRRSVSSSFAMRAGSLPSSLIS